MGEWARARTELDEFIRRNPRDPWSRFHRAYSRVNLGDHDGAIVDCDLAIDLNSEVPLFYALRALALAMRHKLDRALADVERAASDPAPTIESGSVPEAGSRAQRGDYAGGLADYHRSFRGRPLDVTMLADQASASALAGHFQAAEADFEAALRAEPVERLDPRPAGPCTSMPRGAITSGRSPTATLPCG